jgi:hypothetical protein
VTGSDALAEKVIGDQPAEVTKGQGRLVEKID